MEYFEEIQDRVILIGVQADRGDDMEESLDELGELAKTAGAEVVGRMIQPRENIHPGTYIGKGKILELKEAPLFSLHTSRDIGFPFH